MSFFRTMLTNYQTINVKEKGISFEEQGFTQLYEEGMKDLNYELTKGVLIGAAGVGLIWLSKVGFDKFIKPRFENVKEETEVGLGNVLDMAERSVGVGDDHVIRMPVGFEPFKKK